MKWNEWAKAVAGTAREHLGVAAASVGVIVAMGIVAAGGFAGCRKQETAAMADTFPVKPASASATPTPKPIATAAKPKAGGTIIVYVTGAVKRPGVYTLTDDARLYHAIRAAGGFKSNAVTDALNLADRAQDGDQLCVPSRQTTKATRPAPQTVALAPPRLPAITPAPLIRKTLLPAPIVLPTANTPEETEPNVTVLATPTPSAPGRVLGVPTAVTTDAPTSPATEPAQVTQSAPPSGRITLPAAQGKSTRTGATKTGTKFKNPGDGIVHINSATAAELEQLPRCGPAMSAKILAYRAQIGGKFTDLRQLMDVKGCGEKTFAKWEPFLAL
jgi:DNA uptake protein ComE-like DNA-binding protein